MKKTITVFNKKVLFFGVVCLLTLTGLVAFIGCSHIASIYAPSTYTVEDLNIDREYASMEVLQGYRNYSGTVIKVSPLNSERWVDYSRSVLRDLNLPEPGPYQITVSMSVMVERPDPNKASIAAYRTSVRGANTPTKIKWNGPGNVGWTIQNGYDFYSQFGGNAVEVPVGRWVDLSFSQAFDFPSIENLQLFMDGHNDHQGLLDLTLYVRHYKVTVVSSLKYVALTFNDGPSDFTQFLLDKLDEHEVKGTFFVTGMAIDSLHPTLDRGTTPAERVQKMQERRETIKRIVDDGHEAANLSYSYNYLGGGRLDGTDGIDSFIKKEDVVLPEGYPADYPLSEAAIRKELEDTQLLIQKSVYGDTEYGNYPWVSKFFRIPFGSDLSQAPILKKVVTDLGLPVIGGTKGPESRENIEEVVDAAIKQIAPWGVCEFRDLRTDPSLLKILDSLIPKLKAEGYLFVTLSDMVTKRREALVPGDYYNNLDPESP